jgi:hypothetical protein
VHGGESTRDVVVAAVNSWKQRDFVEGQDGRIPSSLQK